MNKPIFKPRKKQSDRFLKQLSGQERRIQLYIRQRIAAEAADPYSAFNLV